MRQGASRRVNEDNEPAIPLLVALQLVRIYRHRYTRVESDSRHAIRMNRATEPAITGSSVSPDDRNVIMLQDTVHALNANMAMATAA